MKVLVLAYGSRGDVQPFAALAIALKAQGHTVRFLAPENFEAYARALGLDYVGLPGDTRKLTEDALGKRYLIQNNARRFLKRMADLVRPGYDALADALYEAASGQDLIVAGAVVAHLAASVAEAKGAAFADVHLVPYAPTRGFPPPILLPSGFSLGPFNAPLGRLMQWGWWQQVKGDVQRARKRWGMQPASEDPQSAHFRKGGLTLMAVSEAFCPRPKDWPVNLVQTGPWNLTAEQAAVLPGDHRDEGFARWIEEGAPPVFFGLGSMPVLDPMTMMDLVGEVCEDLDLRGVLGLGWSGELKDLADCDLPEGLALSESCDHAWLFPQCSAVMHHGGSGTTQAASLAGCAQVVCPVFADQPWYAQRIQTLGAGVSLPFRRLNPDRLKRALLQAFDEGLQARAGELGQQLRAEPGVEAAVLAIKNYLGAGQNGA